MTTKVCGKCGVTKPTTEFNKNASKRDGLAHSCKVCTSIAMAAWREANPENVKAHSAKWKAANKDKVKACDTKWRTNNRELIRTRQAAKRIEAGATPWSKTEDERKARRKEALAKYRAAHPERIVESQNKYRKANRDEWLQTKREWAKRNPMALRLKQHKRRAMKAASGGDLSKGLAERLFKLQRGKCACGCGQPLGNDYHLDHRMPLALGGSNTDNNIQLLTATCNLKKGAKHPVDFMQSRGFLL